MAWYEILAILAAWIFFGFYGAFLAFVIVLALQIALYLYLRNDERRTRTYRYW